MAPLARDGSSIVFSGNQAVARAALANDTTVETLPTGAAALGLANAAVVGSELPTALTESTRLIDARGGRGIEAGVLRLTDGSGWVEVDLRGSVTIGDVADRIAAIELSGRQLAVDIDSDSLTIRYEDDLNGTLGIEDSPGWKTAVQMNISNPLALQAPPIVGGGLSPKTTLMTRLADLNDGAGVDVSAGIVVNVGDKTVTVDLSQAETIDDVLTAINRSEAGIVAELNTTTGAIQLKLMRSGDDYSIGENGGTAAAALGIRTDTKEQLLSSLLKGRGLSLHGDATADLTIRRPDGRILDISAAGLETVGDVIDAINNHASNQDNRRITASLAAVGNQALKQITPSDRDAVRANILKHMLVSII